MRKLLFSGLLFFSLVLFCQAQADRNPKPIEPADSGLSKLDTTQMDQFVIGMEQWLNHADTAFAGYFFNEAEAVRFTTNLIAAGYPDVTPSLSSDIIKRNQAAMDYITSVTRGYDKIKLITMEFRPGLTPALNGILIKLSAGNDEGWKESFSLLLTRFESELKILSLKDEN